ncbi:MAG TPA: hypothetical protein VFC46_08120, partial [Humisphaera sp.]|nr:hypothetical protein [Humisphaera sp.]
MMLTAATPGVAVVSVAVNTTQDTHAVNPAASALDASGNVSLRSAVEWADVQSSDSTITFDPTAFATAQTIRLTNGELDITNTANSLTITGPSAPVTVDGRGLSNIFAVESGVTAEIDNLTISNGKAASGGGILDDGSLTLNNDTLSHNTATSNGGALGVVGGQLFAADTTFDSNTAGSGGAIYEDGPGMSTIT